MSQQVLRARAEQQFSHELDALKYSPVEQLDWQKLFSLKLKYSDSHVFKVVF